MNCQDAIRGLSGYIDGELELAIRQELERHLEHCEDCTVVLVQTRHSLHVLCHCEPAPLPTEVRSRLHKFLRERIGKKPN